MERTKKYLNYLFLNILPAEDVATWARIGKSTEWTDTMNPSTTSYDYIEDSSPTEELDSYAPTTSMPLTAYVGDPAYDFVFKLYEAQAAGTDAVSEVLRVFQQKSDGANVAQLTEVLITIDNYNIATGVLTFNLAQRGTPTHGTAIVSSDGVPTFTPAVVA